MSIRSELNGKNVLVTGAASGIGRALTERFLDAGAAVAALDVDEPGLERLAQDLSGRGRLAVVRCDLGNPEDIITAAAEAESTVGPVDILVNNAGIVTGDHFVDLDDADLVRTFEVNSLAPMRMTRALLPGMIQRGSGHVVTIASAGGLIATARLSAYSASKFAAVGFDEALRVEMKEAGHPIRTTLVCPYFIDTGMFAGVRSSFPLLPVLSTDRVADRIVRAVAHKRRRLLMPWLVYLVFPLRLLPVGLFDGLARLLGVTGAMRGFRGREPDR